MRGGGADDKIYREGEGKGIRRRREEERRKE